MKNLFTENRLVFMSPKENPSLGERLSTKGKLPARVIRRGDRLYNRMMQKASTKLSPNQFKKRLSKSVIPKMAKKYIDKHLAAIGMQDQGGKKARKLATLMAGETYRFRNLASLRDQSAINIGRAAFKVAGYSPKPSDEISISMKGKKSIYEEYENPCSKMNGKVPKAKLRTVIAKANKIASSGINKAVARATETQLRKAMRKHGANALSG